MKSPYEQAPHSLRQLLTRERVEAALSSIIKSEQNACPQDKDDRGYWYSKSYPVFLKRFDETRSNNKSESAWIERTACVFSWIPRIPVVRLDENALFDLAELENLLSTSKLWEIGTESYLGGLNDPIMGIHHGERIFGTGAGNLPVLIKEFVKLANSILNYGEERCNFPTTTKLLHFMFPNLFPIFDSNVCQALYGNARVEEYNKYHAYIFSLQDFLRDEPVTEAIFRVAQETKLPVLRVVDLVLFQDGIHKSRSKKLGSSVPLGNS